MKEIFKITASLTAVCIAAALILGAVYTQTEHARKQVEKAEKEEIIRSLLGFGHGHEAPSDLTVFSIYRYVISDSAGNVTLGYVIPMKDGKVALAQLDLQGKLVKVLPIEAKPLELADQGPRDAAANKAVPQGSKATYAETFYIADRGSDRLGYVLPGITQGFKTFVKLMVSLDPKFTVTGVAITESEEDPGLGAEIQQAFFRNQFVGKTLDMLKGLTVVKEPLPTDYLDVLDPLKTKKAGLTPQQITEIKDKHLKDNIYALTGATISSRAVTRGVQDTVRKFAYRFDILKKAIDQEKVQVAF
jgi:Na+-translocating ferredoxin:NAD+ oxidoreductase subunit G